MLVCFSRGAALRRGIGRRRAGFRRGRPAARLLHLPRRSVQVRRHRQRRRGGCCRRRLRHRSQLLLELPGYARRLADRLQADRALGHDGLRRQIRPDRQPADLRHLPQRQRGRNDRRRDRRGRRRRRVRLRLHQLRWLPDDARNAARKRYRRLRRQARSQRRRASLRHADRRFRHPRRSDRGRPLGQRLRRRGGRRGQAEPGGLRSRLHASARPGGRRGRRRRPRRPYLHRPEQGLERLADRARRRWVGRRRFDPAGRSAARAPLPMWHLRHRGRR